MVCRSSPSQAPRRAALPPLGVSAVIAVATLALVGALAITALAGLALAPPRALAAGTSGVSSLGTIRPGPAATPAAEPTPTAGPHTAAVDRVVVLLSPFLTWDDLSPERTPALWALAGQGAIANMNALTADPGWPTAAGGALTLSASRWAQAAPDASAEASALPAARSANATSLAVPDLGALGAVVRAAGGRTAAIGNGDEDTSTPTGIRRPAALVATDRGGMVDRNLTGEGLLAADPAAPFGVRSDPASLRAAVAIALLDSPSLIVVDPGDLERAHDAPSPSAGEYAARHAEAVAALDKTLGDLQRSAVDSSTLLLVVTPATDKPYYQPPYFGPVLASGAGLTGTLTSASTHRPALIANLDIAPTILSALGLETTTAMTGRPVSGSSAGAGGAPGTGAGAPGDPSATIAHLARLGRWVGAVDYVRDLLFLPVFIYSALIVALLAAALAFGPALLKPLGRWAILLALSVPPAAWAMTAVSRYPQTPAAVLTSLALALAIVFALALALSLMRRLPVETPILALSIFTTLVVIADQWSGRPLETGLFSYSIRAGWRFYGVGNEDSALLVAASIVAVGMLCDLAAERPFSRTLRLMLMPAVGLIVLVTAAAPFMGANDGVAVWGLIAFAVAWLRINRLRINWKSVLGILGAMVVLLGAFVVLDMMRGLGGTHLARFVGEATSGNGSAVWSLVYRKAMNNYGFLLQTPYTWLTAALVAALAAVWWVPPRPLSGALAARPGVRGALAGVLVGALFALLTEDSGITMPALMLFAAVLPALYLALWPAPAPLPATLLDPDAT